MSFTAAPRDDRKPIQPADYRKIADQFRWIYGSG